MIKTLIAMVLIFILLLGWLVVQAMARNFARKHPEFGPAREEGQGCGTSCLCSDKSSCQNRKKTLLET
ncbi:MAG: chemotaxis protein [Gammaproteobacteria bacterium]|nr:MAG: chemotaxis protein [Gammaproteobacteria bacterium]